MKTIYLATNDKRLLRKAERLFADSAISLHILANEELTHIQALKSALYLRQTTNEESETVWCIDLDAQEFQPLHLADTLFNQASFSTQVIGFGTSLDPQVLQNAKLHHIEKLLQRFQFEKLLEQLANLQPK